MSGLAIVSQARRKLRREGTRRFAGVVRSARPAPATVDDLQDGGRAISEQPLLETAVAGFPRKTVRATATAAHDSNVHADAVQAIMNRLMLSPADAVDAFVCVYLVWHRLSFLFIGSQLHTLWCGPPADPPTTRLGYLLDCLEFLAARSAWDPAILSYAVPRGDASRAHTTFFPFGADMRCASALFVVPPRDPLFKIALAVMYADMRRQRAGLSGGYLVSYGARETITPWWTDDGYVHGCAGYLYWRLRPAVAFAYYIFIGEHLSPELRPDFEARAQARLAATPGCAATLAMVHAAKVRDAGAVFRGWLEQQLPHIEAVARIGHESGAALLARFELH